MAAVNHTEQRPKPSTKNEELGLRWRILIYALHGGKHSKFPPNYSIHNRSNDIVVTALSGQPITVNNLNNDYNDIIKYKFNNVSFQ